MSSGTTTYYELALKTAQKAFAKTHRAYSARPDLLTNAHDDQMYQLGRGLGHSALGLRPDLAPGEPRRY